ncbi:MAG TPA: hypothetical protein VIR45_07230 [Kiloniellaceae bacterium]
MKNHKFTIIAAGLDPQADDFDDRFFEAGCSDATISFQKGAILLDFDRDARTFSGALMSAIADVRAAGAKVVHVEPDHLVSLAEIAVRAKISRAAATNYAKGSRGQGFPPPVARVITDHPLWDWVDVARWLHKSGRLPAHEVVRARLVRRANLGIAQERNGGGFHPRHRERRNRTAAA